MKNACGFRGRGSNYGTAGSGGLKSRVRFAAPRRVRGCFDLARRGSRRPNRLSCDRISEAGNARPASLVTNQAISPSEPALHSRV